MNSAFEAELYAHAIATEAEAARRYAELAERMAQQDERAAALFRWLAQAEARRLADLRRESAGLELPDLTADHSWPMDAPDPLNIALRAEKAARAFFEQAARTAPDPAVRVLALEMAAEEAAHAELITRLESQR
jgi:rubrerythrin